MGITAGSLPALRPLVSFVFGQSQASSARRQRAEGDIRPSNAGNFVPIANDSKGSSNYYIADDEYHAALGNRI